MKESDSLYCVFKVLIILCSALLICLILWYAIDVGYITLAAGGNIEKTPIEISCSEENMAEGESIKLSYQIVSPEVNKDKLQWVSSNPEAVSLENNKATGVAPGEAEIYLTDGSLRSNTIKLQCVIRASEVQIINKIEDVYVGQDYQLETQVLPQDATYKTPLYSSLNSKIATVDENGHIEALSPGTTQIVACDVDKKCFDSFMLHVMVKNVESVELDDKEVELKKGQYYILEARVLPLDASYREVEWESSNPKIATVDCGRIKALSVGTTEIMAITDRGAKCASCIITVTKSKEAAAIKYAGEELKVRSGSSPDSEELCTIAKYDSIQILKNMGEGIYKVRVSDGICGYMECSSELLDAKPTPTPAPKAEQKKENTKQSLPQEYRIWDVPYINQFMEGYPTGCEIVSSAMVLQYKGFSVTVGSLAEALEKGSSKYQDSSGTWYGANPFKEFVGNPSNYMKQGSYGCFAAPIARAMERVAPGCGVKDISGCSQEELFGYVASGHPVIVWCVKNAGTLKDGVKWNYTDGSGSYSELVGEHCAVLIGYDDAFVYLNDPSAGENAKQPKDKFLSNWEQLYSQAIIVK